MFKDNILAGKNILVTGGGTGIGRSLTENFCKLGANAIILSRKEDVLKKTSDEINEKLNKNSVKYKTCDISNAEMVEQVVDELFHEYQINALLNNAAGNFIARSETLSARAFDAISKIVYNGTAYMTLACGKKWIQNSTKATVLSIATTYASTGSAYVLPSAMAKAGVVAMTRSLAVEWGAKGIRFNAIAPGPFPTPGAWERLVPDTNLGDYFLTRNPLQRAGKHEEIANLGAYLMSDFSEYINGDVITIDGGEWLQGAGEFNFLKKLTDSDWEKMKTRGKSK